MIPYDLDPSLHTAEPEPQQLDDGFSPRERDAPHEDAAATRSPVMNANTLGDKSAF